MKKPVTTIADFREALRQVQDEVLASADLESLAHAANLDPAELPEVAEVMLSEPVAVPPRGRGDRISLEVFTLWNQPPFGTDADPLGELRRRVSKLVGVEEVGEAIVDPQLRSIWGFSVILRLSQ